MEIGVPPKSTFSDQTIINSKDTVHKIKLIPCKIKSVDPKSLEKSAGNRTETILKLFSLIGLEEVSSAEVKALINKSVPQYLQKYINQYLNNGKEIEIYATIAGSLNDSFTNQFQEHFFKKLVSTIGNLPILGGFMKGARSFLRSMGWNAQQTQEGVSRIGKGIASLIEKADEGVKAANKNNLNSKGVQQITGSLAALQKVLEGSAKTNGGNENVTWQEMAATLLTNDLDFPQVWAGSSFNMDASIKIVLYNPFPASDEAYYKYIMAPIALLSTIVAPRSGLETESKTSAVFVGSPFYLKIEAPGLIYNPFGAISNMTISRGGDQGAIAPNNRMISATINLTFKWLFSALVTNSSSEYSSLKKYLDVLSGKDEDKTKWQNCVPTGRITMDVQKQVKNGQLPVMNNTQNKSANTIEELGSRINENISLSPENNASNIYNIS